MKRIRLLKGTAWLAAGAVLLIAGCFNSENKSKQQAAMIAGYTASFPGLQNDLSLIPASAIINAKSKLHIAYGHTSHGSQLITGMDAIARHRGDLYAFNTGGTGGALDLRDRPFSGASDLGNPNRTAWDTATRNYLTANPEINVIIWSWCGQVSSATEADITNYLTRMSDLEDDYPGVTFVYMTGHSDGGGLDGNLHLRNEQIRNFCAAHGRVLFDFERIESYDPGGNYFGNRLVTDGCGYDLNGDGTTGDGNWADDWVWSHPSGEPARIAALICSDCCAHSRPLNCAMKGVAAWFLWARIAEHY